MNAKNKLLKGLYIYIFFYSNLSHSFPQSESKMFIKAKSEADASMRVH